MLVAGKSTGFYGTMLHSGASRLVSARVGLITHLCHYTGLMTALGLRTLNSKAAGSCW